MPSIRVLWTTKLAGHIGRCCRTGEFENELRIGDVTTSGQHADIVGHATDLYSMRGVRLAFARAHSDALCSRKYLRTSFCGRLRSAVHVGCITTRQLAAICTTCRRGRVRAAWPLSAKQPLMTLASHRFVAWPIFRAAPSLLHPLSSMRCLRLPVCVHAVDQPSRKSLRGRLLHAPAVPSTERVSRIHALSLVTLHSMIPTNYGLLYVCWR
uniref:FHA domain-containing protein n=1 Tax=Ascaris lumbricoides TaxID=6252 RepID=A0A0M3I7J9_ASCLU